MRHTFACRTQSETLCRCAELPNERLDVATCLITLACPLCQAPVTHDCVMTDTRLEYDPNATREDTANEP